MGSSEICRRGSRDKCGGHFVGAAFFVCLTIKCLLFFENGNGSELSSDNGGHKGE